ncbi:MAG: hypothetical protein H6682_10240 [Candidatus Eisenbacteria bacterium]|nr:hypothetical protein [Candidatus Eisenbacteria bacterium]
MPRTVPVLTLSALSVFALATFATQARSGANAGGYLLLHTDDTVIYTEDDASSYCNELASECGWDPECDDDHFPCESALANLNPTSGRGPDTAMIWAIAAFPPESCPAVAAIQFGLTWPVSGPWPEFVDWNNCGDFEISTDYWPNGLVQGTAVTWYPPVRRTGFPVYWFAAYSYYGPVEIAVDDFPVGPYGLVFADDQVPAALDPVPADHRGSVGLNGATGWNPYTVSTPVGACCADDGTCAQITEDECQSVGGQYVGDGAPCEPNPCNITPVLDTSWGAVKSIFRN